MSREELVQALAAACERLIASATEAERRGVTVLGDGGAEGGAWGPREIVAHIAGWEVMATVRVPRVAAGMPPLEFADETQQDVMNAAINAAFGALIGEQSLDSVCAILRQAYRRDIAMLQTLDDAHFRPGTYVYERTRGVIEHCQEHGEQLLGG